MRPGDDRPVFFNSSFKLASYLFPLVCPERLFPPPPLTPHFLCALLAFSFPCLLALRRVQLPEEHELIWDDGVTPETCLDFDAQHIDTYQGLLQWMGGLGFFVSLGAFMKYVWKPDTLRAPAPREFPYNGLVVELGGNAPADADGDDEE